MINDSPLPVKLICAITLAPDINLDDVIIHLENAFGPIDDKSEIIRFDYTYYYTPEMGHDLKKVLVSFYNPFKAENLWAAKRTAIDIEKMFTVKGNRRVNLDPGYLETSKLILASTKNFSHRIYLNEGIWAEVTLIYADDKFNKLPWTYPDYLKNEFITFLEKIRKRYKSGLQR